MNLRRHGLFLSQLFVIAVLVLFTQVHVSSQLALIVLCASLIGLWVAGAIVAPVSLVLSAFALSGTVGILGHQHIDGIPFSVNGILVANLGAISALTVVLHYRQLFKTPRQLRQWVFDSAPFLLFLLWAIIRLPATPSFERATSDILIWGAVFGVYMLARAYWITHPQQRAEGDNFFVYTALFLMATVLIDALLGNIHINFTSSASPLGIHTISGARSMPPFLALIMTPMLVQLRFNRWKTRLIQGLAIGMVLLLGAWVYFSLARITLTGLLGVVVPLTLLRPRGIWKAGAAMAVASIATVVLILSPLYPRPTMVKLDAIVTAEEADDSSNGNSEIRVHVNTDALRGLTFGRSNTWEYLLTELRHDPTALIFGFGPGASYITVKAVNPGFDHPHNDYLRIFFDLGLIGLLIFLGSWAYKTLRLWLNWLHFEVDSPVATRNFVALVATINVFVGFLTDNFLVYFFMMGMLALIHARADAAIVNREATAQTTQHPIPAASEYSA